MFLPLKAAYHAAETIFSFNDAESSEAQRMLQKKKLWTRWVSETRPLGSVSLLVELEASTVGSVDAGAAVEKVCEDRQKLHWPEITTFAFNSKGGFAFIFCSDLTQTILPPVVYFHYHGA